MKVSYQGRNRTDASRVAWVSWNDEEEVYAERVIDFLYRVKGWQYDGFDNCVIIEVADKEEYEEFVEEYKTAKKMIRNCMKFGF